MSRRKVAIYSRKSKITGKGESIENQIELCKEYLQLHFPEITDDDIVTFEDEGYSGKNLKRPQFQSMFSQIKEGKFSILICYRLDRISRNVSDFSNTIEDLKLYDVDFISIKENFDTSTPMGKAMMYISSVFAELERDTIAERIRDNMYELAKTGRWLGGTTPTGYKSTPIEKISVDGKTHTAYKLSIINEEADLIRLIYSKFIELNSQSKLQTFLINNGYKTKQGKDFRRYSIKAILENPVYACADADMYNYLKEKGTNICADISKFDGKYGVATYNKTKQIAGQKTRLKSFSEWIVSVGKHKPIISSADWIKVQKLLDINKSKAYRKPRSHTALLSGLLRCGHCGDFMRPKMYHGLDSYGNQKYGYLCNTKAITTSHKCKMKNPPGNIIDKAVCDEIKKLVEDESEFMKQFHNIKTELTAQKDDYLDSISTLNNQINDIDSQINNLVSILATNPSSANNYIFNQIEELDSKKNKLIKRREELKGIISNEFFSDDEFELLRDMIRNFKMSFDYMSIEEKRAALRMFISKVVWDGEHCHIYFIGAPNDFPYKKKLDDLDLHSLEPLCRDSKRSSYVFTFFQKTAKRGIARRQYRYRPRRQQYDLFRHSHLGYS